MDASRSDVRIKFAAGGTPLSSEGFKRAAEVIGVGATELWAVLSVETAGCGYLTDRRPKILFERHVFSRRTGGRFDIDDPDISSPSIGGYGQSGAHQYDRLNAAMQLDPVNALQSASWGIGQIMGENHTAAGFPDVASLVEAVVGSEDGQLLAMTRFLDCMQLAAPLRDHDWCGFARRYNGPDYAAHNYDGLLQHFFGCYSNGPAPDLTVRAVQIYLTYEGYSVATVDGILGPRTRAAISAFQQKAGLACNGNIDEQLLSRLSSPATPEE